MLAAVSAFRSIILMRKKEYRIFPILFLFFGLGAVAISRGTRRYLASDVTLIPSFKNSGQAWYQDIGVGLTVACVAVYLCWHYIEGKEPNKNDQTEETLRRSSDARLTQDKP
jgi:hypothetical protein